MPISKETILRVSRLARLDLEAEGEEAFVGQVQGIVDYIDMLETIDTDGVEPLYSPLRLTAPPRADLAVQEYPREEILRGAPEQEEGFFVVPKVI